jgi:hypothetical protein
MAPALSLPCALWVVSKKHEVEHESVSSCDLVGNDRRHVAGVSSVGAALPSSIFLLRVLRIRFLRIRR